MLITEENLVRSAPTKSARLETRITAELRDRVRRAADLQGRSVSEYVAATLQAAVQRDIGEQAAVQRDIAKIEIISLSREASEKFAESLIDPPHVNAALKRAFARHRRNVRQE